MTQISKIRNFNRGIPMGATHVSVLKEHGNAITVEYYQDSVGKVPLRAGVASGSLVLTRESYANLIGEKSYMSCTDCTGHGYVTSTNGKRIECDTCHGHGSISEAKTPLGQDKMQKLKGPALGKQGARKTRKAEKGGDGDKDVTDHRGALRFPHSGAEEDFAKSFGYKDYKKRVVNYPTYRQTGIDSSQWVMGKDMAKMGMKNEDYQLNTRGFKNLLNEDRETKISAKDIEEFKKFVDNLEFGDSDKDLKTS